MTNTEDKLRKKFEEAIQKAEDKSDQADAVIWIGVLANAGMGVVPLGINIMTFMGVSALMVVFIGRIYGYSLSKEDGGKLIKQIFGAASFTFMALNLGLKVFAEVLKGVGVITMGGTTIAGMALDAVLAGTVTYALGYTAKDYFAQGKGLSKEKLRKVFESKFNVTFAPPSTKRIIGNLVGTTPHWGGEKSTFQGNAVVFTPSLMVLASRSVLIQL